MGSKAIIFGSGAAIFESLRAVATDESGFDRKEANCGPEMPKPAEKQQQKGARGEETTRMSVVDRKKEEERRQDEVMA